MLTFLDSVTILINLVTLSVAIGWILTLVIQPYRQTATYWFVGFCATVAAWAFLSLWRVMESVGMIFNVDIVIGLQSVMGGLMMVVFFCFILFYLVPKGRIVDVFTLGAPVLLLIAFGLIASGQAYTYSADSGIRLEPFGYALQIAFVVYAALTFWIVLSSAHPASNQLVFPTAALVPVYVVNLIEPLINLPLDSLFLIITVTWAGWTLLRSQVFEPLQHLNDELRTTNRGLQHVINDLASEKAKTEELNRELTITNQYKSEFLANISHELRTPLNSIIGYSELLNSGIYGEMNDKQRDRVEKIHRNGMGLLDLISDILDLNKIDAGKMELDVSQFDIHNTIEAMRPEIERWSAEKGLALTIDMAGEIPALYGDQSRIAQVIRNLVDNAVKFTRVGSVSLSISGARIKNGNTDAFKLPAIGWLRDGLWVIVRIEDTGIGIPTEHQSRIFDEFSQVDGSHTREFSGTGLGLAISRRLVEMHSGTIWVNSVEGQGSTFFVALPAGIKHAELEAGQATVER